MEYLQDKAHLMENEKITEMNRLIIIGNGFDLAHGMKTSYYDFINDHIIQVFFNRYNGDFPLVKFKSGKMEVPEDEIIDFHQILQNIKNEPQDTFEHKQRTHNIEYNEISYKFILKLIEDSLNKNWVDIEKYYYDEIKTFERSVKDVNIDFESIKINLEVYIQNLINLKKTKNINKFNKIFHQPTKTYFSSEEGISKKVMPSFTLFLNFNYTDTIKGYYE